MKINHILFITILFFVATTNAQFTDDMEWSAGNCSGHWVGICPIISTEYAHSGSQSGLIPGDGVTVNVLDLGNKIFGEWGLEFWVYIPSDKDASFSLQGVVPITTGQSVVGNILFNPSLESPGVGKITDTAMGEVSFNFPHNEWFVIVMWWDIYLGIGASTWELYIDGEYVIPEGTPFTNENGDYPTSLGGIEFFSSSVNTTFYLDDFNYHDMFFVGTEDNVFTNFILFPNPAKDVMHISSQATIKNSRVYDILGNIIKETSGLNSIDISNLSSGVYFIEVSTDTGKSIQKFIKE